MRRTKIVCTIGPASDSEQVLEALFKEGLDVCRLNFSHGTQEEHLERLKRIKNIRNKLNLPIATMLDTKGPEIRLGVFKDGMRVNLETGDRFTLTTRELEGDEKIASVSYKDLPKDVRVGSRILIDDGLVELRVESVEGTEIHCSCFNGGEISSRKGVNVPDAQVNLPALTEKDISDIKFAVRNDMDFIAASFIRKAEDVLDIRKILEEEGDYNIKIISKIESKEGLENLDEIIEASDGIMVARGDLGVEIDTEKVPIAQKNMIKKCNEKGKVVITATQMLDSMIRNPRPTRAEANDVANAVLDGTSCVMLSGETASGKYPIQSVATMRKILEVTEESMDFDEILSRKIEEVSNTITNAIGKSTCTIARDLNAKAIITATTSGYTTRSISKFRPKSLIIGATTSEKVRRQLNMEWGVKSILVDTKEISNDVIDSAIETSVNKGLVAPGDTVIITAGVPVGLAGSTNLIKVEIIGEILSKGVGIGDREVTGRAVVIENEEDFVKYFKDGAIVVTKGVTQEITKYLERAGGLVVEESGYTCPSAIVGLNLGLPTVVGNKDITEKIKSGDIITISSSEGTIRKGKVLNKKYENIR